MTSTGRGPVARLLATMVSLALAATGLVALAGSSATAVTAAGTGTGYLHTNGSQIVDATGATVRLTGLNWFGMETDNHTFHGLWASATWKSQMDHMAALGYNTIRVPFTGDSLRDGAKATSINSYSNPDLDGLSPLQVLDKVVDYAGQLGMRIILDRHRPSAAGQTPLWYTSTVSEASEIADWKMLAARYANNPTVVGADLFNEPHAEGTAPNGTGSCWGCGDPARDWQLAAQRIGNAILATNSSWLIVVEGVSCPSGATANAWDNIPDDPMDCGWWGGNLSGVAAHPVVLSTPNRLVYSAHDYGISVYDHQDWFDTTKHPDFPNNLPAVWDHFFGYIAKQNIAPVLVGEFGSTLRDPRDVQWMTKLVSYMQTNGISFTYWSWNPDSGDTGGIVQDDWVTVNQNKQAILQPALVPPVKRGTTPTPTPTTTPTPTQSPTTTPTPTPTPTQSPTTTPTTTPGACTATVKVTNSWSGGFQASITVKNTSSSAVNPWSATFSLPSGDTVQSGWNATYTQSGTTVTARAPTWATSLAAGASVELGFVANGPSSALPTTGVKLAGAVCS
ncbi:cellulase family glycosylhydrolase [Cellulomonas sp. JH27-2]|uniref:cellulase family glycosylhydrolase n=1 Tax=Cellulomonas sp. JH27-2 TaxID=2774139 RepID=UPI001CD8FD8C|nr:cellulase family glycosylhydrolase [Cellulomonas sp. JH27-2]